MEGGDQTLKLSLLRGVRSVWPGSPISMDPSENEILETSYHRPALEVNAPYGLYSVFPEGN